VKIQEAASKTVQSTLLANQYLRNTVAKTADANNTFFGFQGEEEEATRGGRGGRGGRGAPRGGADGNQQRGGRRNPKQSLKKTEEEFPTL